jgi:predicted transcriptional regulator
VKVALDDVQFAWLQALAELHDCSRSAVLRESLGYFVVREYVRLERTVRVEEVRAAQQRQSYPVEFGYLRSGRWRS